MKLFSSDDDFSTFFILLECQFMLSKRGTCVIMCQPAVDPCGPLQLFYVFNEYNN